MPREQHLRRDLSAQGSQGAKQLISRRSGFLAQIEQPQHIAGQGISQEQQEQTKQVRYRHHGLIVCPIRDQIGTPFGDQNKATRAQSFD